MAAAAAALDELDRSGPGGRCGDVGLCVYIVLAASVASEDAPYDCVRGARPASVDVCDVDAEYGGRGSVVDAVSAPACGLRRVRALMGACGCEPCRRFVVRIPSKIWLAICIDMPQKSGTRCAH